MIIYFIPIIIVVAAVVFRFIVTSIHNNKVRKNNQIITEKQQYALKQKTEVRDRIRNIYNGLKIGDTVDSAIHRLGSSYSVEKESKEQGKLIRVLKWYAYPYISSASINNFRGIGTENGTYFGTTINGQAAVSHSVGTVNATQTVTGVNNGAVINRAFIKLTFEDGILIGKEQEGLDFDVA